MLLSPSLSVIFLTVVSALTVYRDRADKAAVSFVVSAYTLLVLFFLSVSWFDSLPPENISKRKKIRVLIFTLGTGVNVLFSWKVSSVMQPAMAAVIWALSLTTAGAGFYMLARFQEP